MEFPYILHWVSSPYVNWHLVKTKKLTLVYHYWPNSRLDLPFTSFSINGLFLLQDTLQGTTSYLAGVYAQALLVCDFLSLPLLFTALIVLSCLWPFLLFLSWLDWGYRLSERKQKKGSAPLIISYQGARYLHADNVDVHFNHLVRMVFAGILHCKITDFPSLFLGYESLGPAHLGKWGVKGEESSSTSYREG